MMESAVRARRRRPAWTRGDDHPALSSLIRHDKQKQINTLSREPFVMTTAAVEVVHCPKHQMARQSALKILMAAQLRQV